MDDSACSPMPKASGIYRIVCLTTGKLYIGSAINLAKRKREHLHYLRNNAHHSITLQRAWDKHGEENFAFEVIELVLPAFLLEREQHYLDTLKPFGENGYNINAVAGSRMGMRHTVETREKLRQANLGKTYGEETRRKHSVSSSGRTHRPEAREKLRQANLGQKRSAEARESMRQAQLGRKQSETTIEKRRLAQMGRIHTPEARAKNSASNIIANEWRMKSLIVTSPCGDVFTIHGIGRFCKEHNLNRSALIQVAKGRTAHHKGWTAIYA